MNPWKPHSSHIQKPAHTQSKAADSSPFPQISMPESTESACAPLPAWGWEGTVRFKAWWRIYLFLHIWCWGIMVKGRIPLSHCAGHRQHYCWKSVLTHTPLQTHTVFGNQESPTACSLTKSRSLRGSSKSSILSIVLKVESRASPCCGAGNVIPLNVKHIPNTECIPQSHIKQQNAYLFNLSLQKIILSQWSM